MTTATLAPPPPPLTTPRPVVLPSIPARPALYRFSVEQDHRLEDAGIVTEHDRVELVNGVLYERPIMNSPHATSVGLTQKALDAIIPTGWHTRAQLPVTLASSEPQPDCALARGQLRDYANRHPTGSDIGLLVEISDSTLDFDRDEKGPVYAADGITFYWIVNLIDQTVEVYSDPVAAGPSGRAGYRTRTTAGRGQKLPLILDGLQVGQLAVDDLLP